MTAGKRNNQKAQRIAAKEKRARTLELRKAGITYQEISDALGIPLSSVGRYVQQGIAEWQKQTEQDAGEIVALEIARIDRMLRGLWNRAKAGDDAAVDRVIKLMDRRAKLLGLDKPAKVAPTDPTGDKPAELNISINWGPDNAP